MNKSIFMRILWAVLGLVMLVLPMAVFISEWGNGKDREEDIYAFDVAEYSESRQFVEFEMISYPFASFELNDTQGLYFVFDEDMCTYIVCMNNNRLEEEFAEIYEYTFSDTVEAPKVGRVEGYSMEIDEEIRDIAIEEFNYMWGEEIATEQNFEEYFGNYYLDTTYIPNASEESLFTRILTLAFTTVVGIILLWCAFAKPKQEPATENVANEDVEPAFDHSPMTDLFGTSDAGFATIGELPNPGNIVIAVAASIAGAALGGVVWILIYKLGYIAAVSGYVAVACAMLGYTKFGKRELSILSIIWCILISAAMIVFANYISYTWEVMDAINASNPGRAEFTKVFMHLPDMLKEWDAEGYFWRDLAMGLLFLVISGIGSLFSRKKR